MKAEIETSAKQISPVTVERIIFQLRGHRVILDSDLAKMYGVTTAALNQAVKRNADRFPEDFVFRITDQEFINLISQTVISSSGYGGRRKLPLVFTEHGVAMLSSVLKSKTATRVNIEIIRTFIRLRRFFAAPGEIITELTKLRDRVSLHDKHIHAISEILEQLTMPEVSSGKNIGFDLKPKNGRKK